MGSPKHKLRWPLLQVHTEAGEAKTAAPSQIKHFHLLYSTWPCRLCWGLEAAESKGDRPLEVAWTHLSRVSARSLCNCGKTLSLDSPKPVAKPLQMPGNDIERKELKLTSALTCAIIYVTDGPENQQEHQVQVEGKIIWNLNCPVVS